MSRAFVKEDVDPPERSGRARAASGLPPGATNYITARGARRLREQLDALRKERTANVERIATLEDLLASVQAIDAPEDQSSIAFGARVVVRDAADATHAFHIVGVDELGFYSDAVSWISPTGKALLAAEVGERVMLDDFGRVEIVGVEYPP